MLLAAAVIAGPGCGRDHSRRADAAVDYGQWLWSKADSGIHAEAARARPGVVPTVWIGSIHGVADSVMGRLALSPRIAGSARVAVVVRFEDTFTPAFSRGDASLFASADSIVGRLMAAASASGVEITEVQLDYDCPERLLARWSALVAVLSRGALLGRTVWVTSLVTHVRQRAYGDLFRAHVAGHILQVFDTGDRMTSSYARRLERLVTRHRLPFRLGVAAFERRLANGRATDHAAWFQAAPIFAKSPWYRGVWVFPGGRAWVPLLE